MSSNQIVDPSLEVANLSPSDQPLEFNKLKERKKSLFSKNNFNRKTFMVPNSPNQPFYPSTPNWYEEEKAKNGSEMMRAHRFQNPFENCSHIQIKKDDLNKFEERNPQRVSKFEL